MKDSAFLPSLLTLAPVAGFLAYLGGYLPFLPNF